MYRDVAEWRGVATGERRPQVVPRQLHPDQEAGEGQRILREDGR